MNYQQLSNYYSILSAIRVGRRKLNKLQIQKNIDTESVKYQNIKHSIRTFSPKLNVELKDKKSMLKLRDNHISTQPKSCHFLLHATKLSIHPIEDNMNKLLTNNITVLIEKVNDPQNLGSILRNLHFLGINDIILSTDNTCEINSTVSSVSVGAAEYFNYYSFQNVAQLKKMNKFNFLQTKSQNESDQSCFDINDRDNITNSFSKDRNIICFGNENLGVSNEIKELCNNYSIGIKDNRTDDNSVIDSLNLSTSVGIIMNNLVQYLRNKQI